MSWEIRLHPDVEAWYLAICESELETGDLIDERFAEHLIALKEEG